MPEQLLQQGDAFLDDKGYGFVYSEDHVALRALKIFCH